MKIEKIYLVPHFHFDFEWWKEEPYHETDTLVILDEAIKMLDTFPEFTYVIDTILPLKMYIEKRGMGFERLKSFIDQGRIEIVGGNIVAPDEVLPIGEALIRQFEEGQTWLNEIFGIQARVAWEIDEFAHPARMPQILVPLGFKYFVFARGVIPFDSMHPTLFNWHDPAGKSQLTTYWWAANYEGSLLGELRNKSVKKRYLKRFFKEMESRLEFEGERSPVPWLMVPLGGDFTVPNELWMDFVRLWNIQKEVKLEFTLPSKYFRMIEAFEIPDYTGRFPHVFDGYFTSREKEKQSSRKNANRLVEIEKLISLACMHGIINSGKELKDAWWEVLKGDSHDTIAGTTTDRVYRKTMSRYENAEQLQKQLIKQAISLIERTVKGSGNFAFNSLNWNREELIQIDGENQLFRAKALSCGLIELQTSSENLVSINDTSMENKFLRIEVNKDTGNISVFDKQEGFYPIEGNCNKTSIIDDVGNLWVTRSIGRIYPIRIIACSVRQVDDLSAVINILEKNRFITIRKEIVLVANSRRISFKTDLEFTGKDKRIDMEFPFSFKGDWRVENIFHTEKAGEGIHPVQNFALYEGKTYKIAIINKGIPGYLLEKNKGKLMLMRSISVFSSLLVTYILKNIALIFRSLMHANTYLKLKLNIIEFPIYPVHNLFLRNFASEGDLLGHGALNQKSHIRASMRFYKESLAWERGAHSFEYAIQMGVQSIDDAVKKALEFNNPLQVFKIEGKGEQEQVCFLLKEVSGIVISSIRRQEDHIIIRAYEPTGEKVDIELEFSFLIKKVLRYSGNSEHIQEISTDKNRFKDIFEPHEIIQYRLELYN